MTISEKEDFILRAVDMPDYIQTERLRGARRELEFWYRFHGLCMNEDYNLNFVQKQNWKENNYVEFLYNILTFHSSVKPSPTIHR